jgi:hypothetical protein
MNPTVITGAKVEFVDVGSCDNSERKCILKIFVVTDVPKEASSVSINSIYMKLNLMTQCFLTQPLLKLP